jgi:hypothetical protein
MRYAVYSDEEIWVKLCSEFFKKHGTWDWHIVPVEEAFHEMMRSSNGAANPSDIKRRIEVLYKSVGIK